MGIEYSLGHNALMLFRVAKTTSLGTQIGPPQIHSIYLKTGNLFNHVYSNIREWISPAFCIYTLDRLVEEKGSGMLRNFDVYLIPVANPDGYAYTWTGSRSRMWRKNRRPANALLFKNVGPTSKIWPQGLPGKSNNPSFWKGTFKVTLFEMSHFSCCELHRLN